MRSMTAMRKLRCSPVEGSGSKAKLSSHRCIETTLTEANSSAIGTIWVL